MDDNKILRTRRSFLKSLTIAALGAPVLLKDVSAQTAKRSTRSAARHSCIVVGAGLAGLAAAYVLKRAGWDVTVLEARERRGGRIHSFRFDQNPDLVCEL